MAERVVLHVGCMKSGTSFLQRTLAENRGVLAAHGFTFPGEGWQQQVLAVIDVRGHRRDGEVPPDVVGAWEYTSGCVSTDTVVVNIRAVPVIFNGISTLPPTTGESSGNCNFANVNVVE